MNTHRMMTRSKARLAKKPFNNFNNPSRPEILWALPNLQKARSMLQLDKYYLEEVLDRFSKVANQDALVSLDDYKRVMFNLFNERRTHTYSLDQLVEIEEIGDMIFQVLSHGSCLCKSNWGKYLDFLDLGCGFVALVAGSHEAKLAVVYELMATREGYLTRNELRDYLVCIYKIVYLFEPKMTKENMGVSEYILADTTSETVFRDLAIKRLSLAQMIEWFYHSI